MHTCKVLTNVLPIQYYSVCFTYKSNNLAKRAASVNFATNMKSSTTTEGDLSTKISDLLRHPDKKRTKQLVELRQVCIKFD